MEQITIEVDGVEVNKYRLTEELYEIGRSRECSIRVNVPDVSRKHIGLERSNGSWFVKPLCEQGIVLNDAPVLMAVREPLNDGAVIGLGNHTVVRFSAHAVEDETVQAPGAEPPPATRADSLDSLANTMLPRLGDDPRTQDPAKSAHGQASGPAEPHVEDATGLGDFPPPEGLPEKDEDGTFGGGEMLGPATMAFDGLHTQAVDEETLAKLREKMTKQSRHRGLPVLSVLGVLAVAGIVGFFVYRTLIKAPPDIPFPIDKQGNVIRMEHVFPIFDTRVAGKGIYMLLPGVTDGVPDDQGNSLAMTVRMGGDRSIPMSVVCKADENVRYLGMTREELMADWIAIANVGGSLVFGAPVMTFQFIGKNGQAPGIAVDYVTYENTATSGKGIVYLVRTGMKRIFLQMEVPEKDYDKIALAMLSPRSYFRVDRTLMERHWETSGKTTISAELVHDYIDRCRLELGRQAPSVWRDIYLMLTAVLRYSCEKNDKETERYALEMLVTMRAAQAEWFRGKRNARESAINRGEKKLAIRLREECRTIFSSPDDLRFNETREWR